MKAASIFFFIAFLMLLGGNAHAQERGIGVSIANIEIEEGVEWPQTIPITITNLSSEVEQFEITFEKDRGVEVTAAPGWFTLEGNEHGVAFVTFGQPIRTSDGLIKIVSTRYSPKGFTTGTGVKIPFHIVQENNVNLLAGAGVLHSWGGFQKVFGALILFLAIAFLWYLANYTRELYEI